MIERIGIGTYHVTIPPQQSWDLYKHIRNYIGYQRDLYKDPYLIVLFTDVKKHYMPDYWENEIGSMGKLANYGSNGPINYDCKIFIGEIPEWRKGVYKAASMVFPQFGREVHFCDAYEEAVALAEIVRERYEQEMRERKLGS